MGSEDVRRQAPNVFSMKVANVMPGDTIAVELRYTELLVPRGDVGAAHPVDR